MAIANGIEDTLSVTVDVGRLGDQCLRGDLEALSLLFARGIVVGILRYVCGDHSIWMDSHARSGGLTSQSGQARLEVLDGCRSLYQLTCGAQNRSLVA